MSDHSQSQGPGGVVASRSEGQTGARLGPRPSDRREGPRRRAGGGWRGILTTGALVLAAFGLGYLFHGLLGPTAEPGDTAALPTAGEAFEVWTCSMHPQIRQPQPGKCPICGMDLIPVASGANESATGLRELSISREARELLNIETSPVERRYATATIRMVGKVDYDETRLGNITAWVPGRLDRLYVDYTGIEVQEGDHMVYIYSPDLYTAQAELIRARQAARERRSTTVGMSGERMLESAREKLRLWGLTAEQIRQIEQQDKPTDHLTIYAPMAGIVIEKNLQEGAYVDTGTRIYTIADLSQVWVRLDAYESDLVWLRYGQEIAFTTEAYPGEVFLGLIAFIDPMLNPQTRTVKVRVDVPNPHGKLKPEMFVNGVVRAQVATAGRVMEPDLAGKWICRMHPGVIKDQAGDCDVCEMPLVRTETLGYVSAAAVADASFEPLVVPASAVLITGTRAVVYVEVPDADRPTYEGREIVLGPRAGDFYLVVGGLEEGERVVTHGNFKLDSALQIAAKPSMMSPEGGAVVSHHHGDPAAPAEADGEDHLHVPPPLRRQFARLQAAYRDVAETVEAGDGEAIQEAFRAFQDTLGRVDAAALEGHAAMLWKELAMRLKNDAVEGHWAASPGRMRQAFESLAGNMGRLRNQFGLTQEAERLLAGAPFEVPPVFQRQLEGLWQSYQAVQAALADDDPEAARQATDSAVRTLAGVDMTLLEGEAHDAWMRVRADLQDAVRQWDGADDLEAQRAAFADLSQVMLAVVTSFKLPESAGPVYQLDCAMAFDGRGASWLQADEVVRNPYFGASMLTCATAVEQIADADAPRPQAERHNHE